MVILIESGLGRRAGRALEQEKGRDGEQRKICFFKGDWEGDPGRGWGGNQRGNWRGNWGGPRGCEKDKSDEEGGNNSVEDATQNKKRIRRSFLLITSNVITFYYV